jgi:uncharacterized membrane protein YebE (DUF533 family)
MNDYILESVLRGVFGGKKRKKSKKALKYLTHGYGGRAGSILSNPNVALTAAGLAWGIFETLRQPAPQGAGPTGAGVLRTGPTPQTAATAPLPPLPNLDTETDDATRLVRLAVSAANADGSMSEQERAAIVRHAGAEAGDLIAREIAQRRVLADIVAGVTDPAQRATLYVLAYTIIRADEQVSGSERIYLAKLADLLRLDPPTIQKLEADTAERIDRS